MPAEDEAVLITAIGDLFLRSPDGRFKFLDTQWGTLEEIGTLPADWRAALAKDRRRKQWFHRPFVRRLRAAHGPLQANAAYSPTRSPALNGKKTAENYTPLLAEIHLWHHGEVHRQIKDLPPGTVITINVPRL